MIYDTILPISNAINFVVSGILTLIVIILSILLKNFFLLSLDSLRNELFIKFRGITIINEHHNRLKVVRNLSIIFSGIVDNFLFGLFEC